MDVEVHLSLSEWEELTYWLDQLNNEFIDKEEYGDRLMTVLGGKLNTRLTDGDRLHLIISKSIMSTPKGQMVN